VTHGAIAGSWTLDAVSPKRPNKAHFVDLFDESGLDRADRSQYLI
jgi:hypothetical protein